VQLASYEPLQGRVQSHQSGPASTSLSDVVLHAIVECGGHKARVLDYLHRTYPDNPALSDISWTDVLAAVQQHLPELKEQIEASTLLELYGLLPQLHKTLVENLSNLDGTGAIKAYMETMTLVQRAVRKDELNVNINDMRWKLVPRDLATIYAKLEASGQLDTIIEHDPDEAA
jgi:hypothetical protein